MRQKIDRNDWSIEMGDYNRSFMDERRLLKKDRRKKLIFRTIQIIIYFIALIVITLLIMGVRI